MSAWVPAEVVLDANGAQILPLRPDGSRFAMYVQCARPCGYLIGVELPVAGAEHPSCLPHFQGPVEYGTYPASSPTVDGTSAVTYPVGSI